MIPYRPSWTIQHIKYLGREDILGLLSIEEAVMFKSMVQVSTAILIGRGTAIKANYTHPCIDRVPSTNIYALLRARRDCLFCSSGAHLEGFLTGGSKYIVFSSPFFFFKQSLVSP